MTAIRSSAVGLSKGSSPPPCAVIRSVSETLANPARSGVTPSRAASSAVASLALSSGMSVGTPEIDTAAEKRPRALGNASSVITAPPPADWPAMVTRAGSPPNAAMLSRTHSRAGSQSRMPRFGTASGSQPNPSKPSR
jgi:hypothetical protein